MNKETKKIQVCIVCYVVLIAGMILEPILLRNHWNVLIEYFIVTTLNAVGLALLPYHRHYFVIHLVFVASLLLCLAGAFNHWLVLSGYGFPMYVAYTPVNHLLNIIQSFALVAGSDRLLGKFSELLDTRRYRGASRLRDL